jgi:hypothetical protein
MKGVCVSCYELKTLVSKNKPLCRACALDMGEI